MSGYAYHVYQEKLLNEIKDEERSNITAHLEQCESLIGQMVNEQKRNKTEQRRLALQNDTIQIEIDKLSRQCRRMRSLLNLNSPTGNGGA